MTSLTKARGGSFAPLRQSVFAVLWSATVLGNIGSFMRDVASSWIVTDLSASPSAVVLIQAAGSLPVFLLAIHGHGGGYGIGLAYAREMLPKKRNYSVAQCRHLRMRSDSVQSNGLRGFHSSHPACSFNA
jgi:hypothetical protein